MFSNLIADRTEKLDAVDIQKLKGKATEMMVEVKNILERNNVNFWIEFGTFLGAVRNGQMIPWDSDIDIGVFDDSFVNRQEVLNDLAENGYQFKYRPDRIKIYKAGWWLGAFNFDLHLYHVDKDIAYISADMTDPSLLNSMFNRLEWAISLFNRKEQTVYRFDDIMKLLAKRFDITDPNSLPEKIFFKKGPYNSELSMRLLGDNFCLEGSPIEPDNITFLTRTAVVFFGKLPSTAITALNTIISKLRPKEKQTQEQQWIPVHLFSNLSEITLCGIPFKGPRAREEYLELLYGPNWRIPNSQWKRKDQGIIKSVR